MVLDTNTIIVGSVPAICMLLFTIIGLKIKISDNISGALQHFAAGLLLSAIGSELLPTLLNANGFKENLYATIGFFLGMGVLIILGSLLPEAHSHGSSGSDHDGDGDEHDHDNEHDHEHGGHIRRRSSVSLRALVPLKLLGGGGGGGGGNNSESALSLRQAAKAINDDYCTNCDVINAARHSHGGNNSGGEGQPLIISSSSSSSSEQKEVAAAEIIVEQALPISFLAAIIVDSFMDGFLIGITGAAGRSATIIMAGSLSVEMSFVGLTLATACHGMPFRKSIPAALSGPLFLIVGSLFGNIVANYVIDNPSMMAGIMGFGTSALLFMVAEELLLEAHENGEHIWWVDVQLYTGFYWGFMSTKFIS